MYKILLLIFINITVLFAGIVYDPYSATDESPIDVNLNTYLDYVSDSMIRKQEVRDRLQELQKPADEFHIDGTAGTITKTTYDLQQNPTITTENIPKTVSPITQDESWSYLNSAGVYYNQYWTSNTNVSAFTNARISNLGTGFQYNYDSSLYSIYDTTRATFFAAYHTYQSAAASAYLLDKSYMLQDAQFKLQSDGLNESFKQTNALNEIKAQIQTGNVLAAANLGVGDTINSNLNSINNRLAASNLYAHEQNSKLDTTNGLLTDIKDTLNSGGDFTGFSTDGINASSDSIFSDGANFIDTFQDKFTEIVDNATSVKSDFDNIKNIISGNDISPFSMISSSNACNISFNFFGRSITPLSSLPGILSRYSAVFSLLTYISIMFLNFKFLFLFFAVGRK